MRCPNCGSPLATTLPTEWEEWLCGTRTYELAEPTRQCREIARLKRQRLRLATLLRHAAGMARHQMLHRFLLVGVTPENAATMARDTVAGDLSEEMTEEAQ